MQASSNIAVDKLKTRGIMTRGKKPDFYSLLKGGLDTPFKVRKSSVSNNQKQRVDFDKSPKDKDDEKSIIEIAKVDGIKKQKRTSSDDLQQKKGECDKKYENPKQESVDEILFNESTQDSCKGRSKCFSESLFDDGKYRFTEKKMRDSSNRKLSQEEENSKQICQSGLKKLSKQSFTKALKSRKRKRSISVNSQGSEWSHGDGEKNLKKRKVPNRPGIVFQLGAKLEAKDFQEKWYPAKIIAIDEEECEVLIHYERWSARFDEWMPMDSSCLRALHHAHTRKEEKECSGKQQSVYKVGEEVLARWADRKMYPAKIAEIFDDGSYSVLFFDGFHRKVQTINIHKLPPELIGEVIFPPSQELVEVREDHLNKSEKKIMKVPQKRSSGEGKTVSIGTKSRESRRSSFLCKRNQSSPSVNKSQNKLLKLFKKEETDDGTSSGKDKPLSPTEESCNNLDRFCEQNQRESSNSQEDPACKKQGQNDSESTSVDRIAETKVAPKEFIVEDDHNHYKCHISGCGKSFRKENLLQSHIKHYHSKTEDDSKMSSKMLPGSRGNTSKSYVEDSPRNATGISTSDIGSPSNSDCVVAAKKIPKSKSNSNLINVGNILSNEGSLSSDVNNLSLKIEKEPCEDVSVTGEIDPAHLSDNNVTQSLPPNTKIVAKNDDKVTEVGNNIPTKSKNIPTRSSLSIVTRRRTLAEKCDPKASPQLETKTLSKIQSSYEVTTNKMSVHVENKKKEKFSDRKQEKNVTVGSRKAKLEPSRNRTKSMQAASDSTTISRKIRTKSASDVFDRKENESCTGETSRTRTKSLQESFSDVQVPSKKRRFSSVPSVLDGKLSGGVFKHEDTQSSSETVDSRDAGEPENSLDILLAMDKKNKKSQVECYYDGEVVHCICESSEESGLMMQCEVCLAWQHGECFDIEAEENVPQKYVCYACLEPKGLRESFRYKYDQDWFKTGEMTAFSFLNNDAPQTSQPASMRATHELTAAMHDVFKVLHSVKYKIKVLKDDNHPDLKNFSSSWHKVSKDKEEAASNTLHSQDIKLEEAPTSPSETLPLQQIFMDMDHSYFSTEKPTSAGLAKHCSMYENDSLDQETSSGECMGSGTSDELTTSLSVESSGQQVTVEQHKTLTNWGETSMESGSSEFNTLTSCDQEVLLVSSGMEDVIIETVHDLTGESREHFSTEGDLQFSGFKTVTMDESLGSSDGLKEPGTTSGSKVSNKPENLQLRKVEKEEISCHADPEKCKQNLLDHVAKVHEELEQRMDLIEEQINALEVESDFLLPDPQEGPEGDTENAAQLMLSLKGLVKDLNVVKKFTLIQ